MAEWNAGRLEPAHPVAQQNERDQQDRQRDAQGQGAHHVARLGFAVIAVTKHEHASQNQHAHDAGQGQRDQSLHCRALSAAVLCDGRAAGMNTEAPRWRAVLVLVAALGTVALTARLGFWQLSRAAQKEAMQLALDERSGLPLLSAADLASQPAQAEAQHHRKVFLRGRWLAEKTVYLDNRAMNGRAGFIVVTPLLLDAGAGAVVVQRGWLARAAADRTLVPISILIVMTKKDLKTLYR